MNDEDRDRALFTLADRVDGLQRTVNVAVVRRDLRRFAVLAFIVFILSVYVAITLHDEHVAHCYPPKDKATQHRCDIFFPLHNHPRTTQLKGEP